MNFDERTTQVSGYSAMLMLGLTQVALGLIILTRIYILGQPGEELRDIQLVMLGSVVGYFILRALLGGNMPVPTRKQGFLAYLVMTIFLFVVLTLWLGPPDLSDWTNNVLPVLVGPALVVIGYWFFAALGRRRLENEIAE